MAVAADFRVESMVRGREEMCEMERLQVLVWLRYVTHVSDLRTTELAKSHS